MALELNQLKKRLLSPQNKERLNQAKNHELRLRFHTEASLSFTKTSAAVTTFLSWVETLLPKDKYLYFLMLFSYPLKSAELVEDIYTALEKVFSGRDAYNSYTFASPNYAQDWNIYRTQQLNEPAFWSDNAWEVIKNEINSVMIVDLSTDQQSATPEPYYYFVCVENIIDVEIDKKGGIEWIMYQVFDDELIVLDNAAYRVFAYKDKRLGEELINNPHDLTYCPSRFLWDTPIHKRDPIVKQSPLTPQLSALDWWLFYTVSKKHLDLYAAYPIYSGYEQDCDYADKKTNDRCQGGFMTTGVGEYVLLGNGQIMRCPICGDKRLAGPGSFVEIPVPTKDQPDLKNPIQITTIDKESLEYNVNETERMRNEIYKNVVGFGGEVSKDQAVNEKQISAAFEGRTAVLLMLKRNFESVQLWATETACKLRYGDMFIAASINYGTSFYLYSAEELYQLYKLAKESGSNSFILDDLSEQIIATEYRNNPDGYDRAMMLNSIIPYPHMTVLELKDMYETGVIEKKILTLRLNLTTFVKRFERENGSISKFGELLSLKEKINIINQTLLSYVTVAKKTPSET